MQGPDFWCPGSSCRLETRAYPYAVPIKTSRSIRDCRRPQLGAGSGKGQKPALAVVTIARKGVGARRLSNQTQTGWPWRTIMRPCLRGDPRSQRFTLAACSDLSLQVCCQLDTQADTVSSLQAP